MTTFHTTMSDTHQDHPKTPEVAALVVALALPGAPDRHLEHLRGGVLESEARRQHPAVHLRLQPGETKVNDLDLSSRHVLGLKVEQKVLGLDVSVDDPECVHVVHDGD